MKKKFTAILDGEEIAFHFESSDGTSALVEIDGREFPLDVAAIGPETCSVLRGGISYALRIAREGDSLRVSHRGRSASLKLSDGKKNRRPGGGADAAQGSGDVVSPMPGKVVKVEVEVGQNVKAGDGIVVVEAMKMENEFKAPRDGTVKALKVKAGDSVEGGAVLAVIG